MSTIKLEFESEDSAVVAAVAALTNSLLGVKEVKNIEVVDAEEVTAPKKPATPRPSRAKAKPTPEPEPEEEEEELDETEEEELDEAEEADITEDDLRELSAKKIGKHKDAIIAKLAKYNVKGWANLPEKHYAAMHQFLTSLK